MLTREKLHTSNFKYKELYDRKVHDPEIKVGSQVYVTNEVKKHKWDSPKLKKPYKIIIIPSEQYVIVDCDENKKKIYKK